MKFCSPTFALPAFALFAAAVDGNEVTHDVACEMSPLPVGNHPDQLTPGGKNGLVQPLPSGQQSDVGAQGDGVCTLTGLYVNGTDVSHCKTIIVDSLQVPPGVTLDLTNVTDGAHIEFHGTSTFGPKSWEGPLVRLTGKNLTVTGPGTLDGQGAWYWPHGKNFTRPAFFRLNRVANTVVSGFTIVNTPTRTFSVLATNYTTISDITIDSRAGNGLAKETDGFVLSRNNHLTITRNIVYNHGDCLGMQSSANTVFSHNVCNGGRGISIGSIGGASQNFSTTVDGLLVEHNTIENSANGLRIKALVDLKGLVTNVKYVNNTLVNVENAIAIRADFDRSLGGYSDHPTSLVAIINILIDGLYGSAETLYDILANPDFISGLELTNINVHATNVGNCTGAPSNVQC